MSILDEGNAELRELLQRVKDMGLAKPEQSGDTYAEQVAELTSRLAPGDVAYIEERGWNQPENIKYLISYLFEKVATGDVEV